LTLAFPLVYTLALTRTSVSEVVVSVTTAAALCVLEVVNVTPSALVSTSNVATNVPLIVIVVVVAVTGSFCHTQLSTTLQFEDVAMMSPPRGF
jgi:hypothetical protein